MAYCIFTPEYPVKRQPSRQKAKTHLSLVNAWKPEYERTKAWWPHESLLNARKSRERTKVLTWTHKSLDINTFRLKRSGHTDSGT